MILGVLVVCAAVGLVYVALGKKNVAKKKGKEETEDKTVSEEH